MKRGYTILFVVIIGILFLLAAYFLIPLHPKVNKSRKRIALPTPPPPFASYSRIVPIHNGNINAQLRMLAKKWPKIPWLKKPLVIEPHRTDLAPWYIEHDFCATMHDLKYVGYHKSGKKTEIINVMAIHYLTDEGQEIILHQQTLCPYANLDNVNGCDVKSVNESPFNASYMPREFITRKFGEIKNLAFISDGSGGYGATVVFKYKNRQIDLGCYGFTGYIPKRAAQNYLKDVINDLVIR